MCFNHQFIRAPIFFLVIQWFNRSIIFIYVFNITIIILLFIIIYIITNIIIIIIIFIIIIIIIIIIVIEKDVTPFVLDSTLLNIYVLICTCPSLARP